jgi:hypothetical protein
LSSHSPPAAAEGEGSYTFILPPPISLKLNLKAGDNTDSMAIYEERGDISKASLEFTISPSKEQPSMVRKAKGWTEALVKGVRNCGCVMII